MLGQADAPSPTLLVHGEAAAESDGEMPWLAVVAMQQHCDTPRLLPLGPFHLIAPAEHLASHRLRVRGWAVADEVFHRNAAVAGSGKDKPGAVKATAVAAKVLKRRADVGARGLGERLCADLS